MTISVKQLQELNPDDFARKCHLCKKTPAYGGWEEWEGNHVCESCYDKKMAIAEAKAFYVPKAKRVRQAKKAILEAIRAGKEIPDKEIAKVILRGLQGRDNALDQLHCIGHPLWEERGATAFTKAMREEGKRAVYPKDK